MPATGCSAPSDHASSSAARYARLRRCPSAADRAVPVGDRRRAQAVILRHSPALGLHPVGGAGGATLRARRCTDVSLNFGNSSDARGPLPATMLGGWRGIRRVHRAGPVEFVALSCESSQSIFANVGTLLHCPEAAERAERKVTRMIDIGCHPAWSAKHIRQANVPNRLPLLPARAAGERTAAPQAALAGPPLPYLA